MTCNHTPQTLQYKISAFDEKKKTTEEPFLLTCYLFDPPVTVIPSLLNVALSENFTINLDNTLQLNLDHNQS